MRYEEALRHLVKLNIEPYWDTTAGAPRFRKVRNQRGYGVTNQAVETMWPTLIAALRLSSKVDTDRVRQELRGLG
jgi:hypothetical protein